MSSLSNKRSLKALGNEGSGDRSFGNGSVWVADWGLEHLKDHNTVYSSHVDIDLHFFTMWSSFNEVIRFACVHVVQVVQRIVDTVRTEKLSKILSQRQPSIRLSFSKCSTLNPLLSINATG